MDKKEAKNIIAEQLKKYRAKPYCDLVQMIDTEPVTYELMSKSDKKYQVEIQAFWDDKPNRDIRVVGSIDDGGLRAFFPLTDGFIKSPDNDFVGE